MDFSNKELYNYIDNHSSDESDILYELRRETELKCLNPKSKLMPFFVFYQSEEFEISNSQAEVSQDIDYSKPDPRGQRKRQRKASQVRNAILV